MTKKTKFTRTFAAIAIFGLIGYFMFSCASPKPKSCREEFERNYERNIQGFISYMAIAQNKDSVTSSKIFRCMMDKLYEIDSTFILMPPEGIYAFFNKNRQALKGCTDLYEQPDTERSCREQFEKVYAANVRALMAIKPGMDSFTAEKILRGPMTKLYEIDSTFVFKTGEEYLAFMKKNAEVLNENKALLEMFDTPKN